MDMAVGGRLRACRRAYGSASTLITVRPHRAVAIHRRILLPRGVRHTAARAGASSASPHGSQTTGTTPAYPMAQSQPQQTPQQQPQWQTQTQAPPAPAPTSPKGIKPGHDPAMLERMRQRRMAVIAEQAAMRAENMAAAAAVDPGTAAAAAVMPLAAAPGPSAAVPLAPSAFPPAPAPTGTSPTAAAAMSYIPPGAPLPPARPMGPASSSGAHLQQGPPPSPPQPPQQQQQRQPQQQQWQQQYVQQQQQQQWQQPSWQQQQQAQLQYRQQQVQQSQAGAYGAQAAPSYPQQIPQQQQQPQQEQPPQHLWQQRPPQQPPLLQQQQGYHSYQQYQQQQQQHQGYYQQEGPPPPSPPSPLPQPRHASPQAPPHPPQQPLPPVPAPISTRPSAGTSQPPSQQPLQPPQSPPQSPQSPPRQPPSQQAPQPPSPPAPTPPPPSPPPSALLPTPTPPTPPTPQAPHGAVTPAAREAAPQQHQQAQAPSQQARTAQPSQPPQQPYPLLQQQQRPLAQSSAAPPTPPPTAAAAAQPRSAAARVASSPPTAAMPSAPPQQAALPNLLPGLQLPHRTSLPSSSQPPPQLPSSRRSSPPAAPELALPDLLSTRKRKATRASSPSSSSPGGPMVTVSSTRTTRGSFDSGGGGGGNGLLVGSTRGAKAGFAEAVAPMASAPAASFVRQGSADGGAAAATAAPYLYGKGHQGNDAFGSGGGDGGGWSATTTAGTGVRSPPPPPPQQQQQQQQQRPMFDFNPNMAPGLFGNAGLRAAPPRQPLPLRPAQGALQAAPADRGAAAPTAAAAADTSSPAAAAAAVQAATAATAKAKSAPSPEKSARDVAEPPEVVAAAAAAKAAAAAAAAAVAAAAADKKKKPARSAALWLTSYMQAGGAAAGSNGAAAAAVASSADSAASKQAAVDAGVVAEAMIRAAAERSARELATTVTDLPSPIPEWQARLEAAVQAEQDSELQALRALYAHGSLRRLQREGVVLAGLAAAATGRLYRSFLWRFSPMQAGAGAGAGGAAGSGGGGSLPYHKLRPGASVIITEHSTEGGGSGGGGRGGGGSRGRGAAGGGDGDETEMPMDGVEGVVLEAHKDHLVVALEGRANDTFQAMVEAAEAAALSSSPARPPCWRLDQWVRDTTTRRHREGIRRLGAWAEQEAEGRTGEARVRAVLAGSRSAAVLASEPPEWVKQTSWRDAARAALLRQPGLNDSQRRAVAAALSRTLTLWQGPPGTGKTRTLLALVEILVRVRSGRDIAASPPSSSSSSSSSSSAAAASRPPWFASMGPLLAVADTNAAVDNIVEGLAARGVKVVRLGPAAKARESLRHLSLEAQAEATAVGRKAAELRNQALNRQQHQQQHQQLEQLQRTLMSPRSATNSTPSAAAAGVAAKAEVRQDLEVAEAALREAAKAVVAAAEVVVATCTAAGDSLLDGRPWRCVVVDEASQATEPSLLVALTRGSAFAVLAGDPRQLPPTVLSEQALKLGLDVTLFERVASGVGGVLPLLLDTQYRMHPAISAFPCAFFYGGRLKDGVAAEDKPIPRGFPWPDPYKPLALLQVTGGAEETSGEGVTEQPTAHPANGSSSSAASGPLLLHPKGKKGSKTSKDEAGSSEAASPVGSPGAAAPGSAAAGKGGDRASYRNPAEALLALAVTQQLLAAGDVTSAAILTPYRGQVRLIEALARQRGLEAGWAACGLEVAVSTVDGYQGREADVVVFSAVRSNPRGAVGFLSDPRRMNVAITRPRRGLVVLGDTATLTRGSSDWATYVKWARSQGIAATDLDVIDVESALACALSPAAKVADGSSGSSGSGNTQVKGSNKSVGIGNGDCKVGKVRGGESVGSSSSSGRKGSKAAAAAAAAAAATAAALDSSEFEDDDYEDGVTDTVEGVEGQEGRKRVQRRKGKGLQQEGQEEEQAERKPRLLRAKKRVGGGSSTAR